MLHSISSEPATASPDTASPDTASRQEALTLTAAQTADLVRDVAAKHGVSVDRARMLIDRFGTARQPLDGAAVNLREWKA